MVQSIKILIIEDHPLISEAYRNALLHVASDFGSKEIKIEIACNCEEAILKINTSLKREGIDIFFLDIRLPPSKDGKILSGEDLGVLIRKKLPDARIIVSTMFNDGYRIWNLIKSLNPDGFLIKDEITPSLLLQAIQTVISGSTFYSNVVTHVIRENISNNFLIDDFDRKILYELSIGTKLKDLTDLIPLSIAGIEKRKRRLNKIFNIKNNDKRSLILKAKKKGFL